MAQDIDHNLENSLYDDICSIIEQARYRVAVYVNSEALGRIGMSAKGLKKMSCSTSGLIMEKKFLRYYLKD